MEGIQPTDQTGKQAAEKPALPSLLPQEEVNPEPVASNTIPNSSRYPDRARRDLLVQQYQTGQRDFARAQLAFLASTKVTHSKEDSHRAHDFLTGRSGNVQQHEEAARAPSYDSDETISDDGFINQSPAIVRGVHGIPVDPVLLEHDRQSDLNEGKKFGPPLVSRAGPVNKTREAMREYLAQKPKRIQTLPVQANSIPFVLPNSTPFDLPFHSKTTGFNTFLPNPIFDGRVKSSENRQIESQDFPGDIQHSQRLPHWGEYTPSIVRALRGEPYQPEMDAANGVSPMPSPEKPSRKVPENEMISTTANAPVEDMYEEFVKEFNYSPTETMDSYKEKTYDQVFNEFVQYPPYEDAVHQANEEFLRTLDDHVDGDILKGKKPVVDQKDNLKNVIAQEKNLGIEKAGMTVLDENDTTLAGQSVEVVKAIEALEATKAVKHVKAVKAVKAGVVPAKGAVSKPIEKKTVEYSGMKSWAPPKKANIDTTGDPRYYVIPEHSRKTFDGPSSSASIWKPNADRSITLSQNPIVDPKLQEDIRLGSGRGSSVGSASGSGSPLPPGYGHFVDGTIGKNTRTEQVLSIRDFEAEDMVFDEDEVEDMSDGELDALVLFPELHKKYGAKKDKGKGKGRA